MKKTRKTKRSAEHLQEWRKNHIRRFRLSWLNKGRKFQKMREALEWTVKDLSEATGFNVRRVKRLEAGADLGNVREWTEQSVMKVLTREAKCRRMTGQCKPEQRQEKQCPVAATNGANKKPKIEMVKK